MKTLSIQSGSNGNCIFYESQGVKLLFDAGISLKKLKSRLWENEIDYEDINGLFISHDHSDHCSSIGIFQRGLGVPVFISKKTFNPIRYRLGKLDHENIIHFKPGETIDIGHIKVHTHPTPHDGRDPCMFTVEDNGISTGICTDLGHPFEDLPEIIAGCDILYFESNYDPDMLDTNPQYPWFLKNRIKGMGGHLSNEESADLIKYHTSDRLKYLRLSHLSENNNTPALALKVHKKIYNGKNKFDLDYAPRDAASPVISL